MTAKRTVRRSRARRVHDPIERALYNRQRREAAPEGFVTKRTLCEKVGLSDHQFRVLAKANVLSSDGANASGFALYKDATVNRLIAMKADGSLFRQLSPRASATDEGTPHVHVPLHASSPTVHYSAEDGVRVFELLRDGKSVADIILETRIHPMLVKAIRVDYDDITGSVHLPKEIVDQLNDFGRAGRLPGGFPIRNGEDMLAVVELCAVDRTCSTCEINAAITSCEDCLEQERRAARGGGVRAGVARTG